MELAGKIIGYCAIVVSLLIYQQKSKKGLLFWKVGSDVLWISHYLIIGGYTGAAVSAVALIRSLLFFKRDSSDPKGKVVLLCFLGAAVICTILTWANAFSLLAMAGSMMSVFSFWLGKPKVTRILAFPIALCMLTYGFINGSTAVVVNETLIILSSILGIIRLDRRK